jgi:hypothetical protein
VVRRDVVGGTQIWRWGGTQRRGGWYSDMEVGWYPEIRSGVVSRDKDVGWYPEIKRWAGTQR